MAEGVQAAGDLAAGQALIEEQPDREPHHLRLGLVHFQVCGGALTDDPVAVGRNVAAAPSALTDAGAEAGAGAVADHVALPLREATEHVPDETPVCAGRVESLGDADQRYPSVVQFPQQR